MSKITYNYSPIMIKTKRSFVNFSILVLVAVLTTLYVLSEANKAVAEISELSLL